MHIEGVIKMAAVFPVPDLQIGIIARIMHQYPERSSQVLYTIIVHLPLKAKHQKLLLCQWHWNDLFWCVPKLLNTIIDTSHIFFPAYIFDDPISFNSFVNYLNYIARFQVCDLYHS